MAVLASSVGHGRSAVLVDECAGGESVQAERCDVRMRLAVRDGVRVTPADPRCRLESAGPPSGVDEHVLVGCVSDDRARIRCDVVDARPGTQQVGSVEDGNQYHCRGQLSFVAVERLSLSIPDVYVYTS